MELVLLDTLGIPRDSIISIRAGSTRRQAPLSQVDETPFRFPCKLEDCGAIKVDVFASIGSGRVVCKPEQREYALRLDATDGQDGEAASKGTVGFRVQSARVPDKPEVQTSKRQVFKAVSDKYLEDHQILSSLQSIMQGLLKDRPADPYGYMAKQFITSRETVFSGYQGTVAGETNQATEGSEQAAHAGQCEAGQSEAELVQLRNSARGVLATGALDGRLSDALTEIVPTSQKEPEEVSSDELRLKMRSVLASAASSGKLGDALQEVPAGSIAEVPVHAQESENETDRLRLTVGSMLSEAAVSGTLTDVLRDVRDLEEPPKNSESEHLRLGVGAMLADAASSGALSDVLNGIKREAGADRRVSFELQQSPLPEGPSLSAEQQQGSATVVQERTSPSAGHSGASPSGDSVLLNLAVDKAMLMSEVNKMQALIERATAKKTRLETDYEKRHMLSR